MRALTVATVLIVATLILGCKTAPDDPRTHNQDYLSHDRIKASINQQVKLMDSEKQQMQHIRDWRALQKEADVLLALRDQETVQISRSRVTINFPSRPIAISDLPTYIPASRKRHMTLAVIMTPGIFPIDPEKPDLKQLMQTIDLVLWRAGVKRCVFETEMDGVYFFWIDSTAAE
jgi:hypothetical protein